MITIDLDDEERRTLINMLTVEIESNRFPLSERIERLKRIRAKLMGEQPEQPSDRSAKSNLLLVYGDSVLWSQSWKTCNGI